MTRPRRGWQVTIDCADPARLVGFWSAALGYARAPAPEGHATWNDWYRSVGVPDSELDLAGDGCDRIVDEEQHYFVVMTDPEGNEFCLA